MLQLTTILAVAALLTISDTPQKSASQDGAPQKAAQDEKPDPDKVAIRTQLPSYPLDTCLVSGEDLGSMGDTINLVVEGRLVRLCCKGCVKKVKATPAKFIAEVDAAVVEAQKEGYALETCPISGEELGSMGKPLDIVHGTRLVRLCCKGCVKGFKKDPEATMKKVDAALIKAQRASYSLKTCVVSDEALGSMGKPVEFLYGTRLVMLCCKGCLKSFHKDPTPFLAKLVKKGDGAKGESHGEKGHHEHGDKKGHGDHGKGHGSHGG